MCSVWLVAEDQSVGDYFGLVLQRPARRGLVMRWWISWQSREVKGGGGGGRRNLQVQPENFAAILDTIGGNSKAVPSGSFSDTCFRGASQTHQGSSALAGTPVFQAFFSIDG